MVKSQPILGVFLATIASFCSALGLIFFKFSHIRYENTENKPKLYCRPQWLFGLFLLIFGQILNTLALGYASVILLASTCCFTIIFNSILAPILLGENFQIVNEGLTINLIIIGSTLCIL